MKGLYKFHFNCGRMGDLYGIFVEDTVKVDNLIASGKEVYFGEVLGKHSEIYGPIEQGDVTFVTSDEAFIEKFLEFELETGFNPFHYIEEEE